MSNNSQNTLVISSESSRYIESQYVFRVVRIVHDWKLQLWIGAPHPGQESILTNIFESTEEECRTLFAHITRSIFEQRDEKLICINIPNIANECLR